MCVMSSSTAQIQVAALLEAEQTYRRGLLQDPSDGRARTNLAWCLLVLFAQRSGAEWATATCQCHADRLAASGSEGALPPPRTAAQFLDECLLQTCRAVQLAGAPPQVDEAKNLQDLVRIAAGDAAFSEVEARAEVAVMRIIEAIRGVTLTEDVDE